MSNVQGQTIRDFYSNASRYGFARDFQFRITTFDVNGVSLEEDNLIFLKTANLPSKTISTTAAPFMGLDFQIPGTVKFEGNNAWNVTFYCTQNYMLRNFLENSMSSTFNERDSTGSMEPKDLNENKIVLSLFDDQLNIVRRYTLLGAFITKVDEIAYDLTKSGGIVEVKATIAYQYWETGPDIGIASGLGLDLGGGVGGLIGSVVGQIGSNVANKLVNKTINKLLGGK